ncbi:MAG: GumC family protein, partial [Mucilaginibacter sp.]
KSKIREKVVRDKLMENNNNKQLSDKFLKQINSSFDFKRLLGSFLSNWYWFVLCLSITITSGFLYLRYFSIPIYEMKSSLLIDESNNSAAKSVLNKLDQDGKGEGSSVNLFNEMFILRSQDLVGQVVDSLELNERFWTVGRLKQSELYHSNPIKIVFDTAGYKGDGTQFLVKQVGDQFEVKIDKGKTQRILPDHWEVRNIGGVNNRFKIIYVSANSGYLKANTEFLIKVTNKNDAVQTVLNTIKVNSSDGRTSLLDISYTDNVPSRGIEILNVLIYFYQKSELKNITNTAIKTREFIDQKKATMRNELHNVDTLVENIQLKNEMIDPTLQTSAYLSEKSSSEEKLTQLYTSQESVNSLRKSIQSNKTQIAAAIGLEDPILANLVLQYNEEQKKLENYKQTFPAKNPYIAATLNEINNTRKRILEATDRISASLRISIDAAAKNSKEFASRLKNVPVVTSSINDAKRCYDILQSIYLFLYQKGVENEISVNSAVNKSKVVVAPFTSGAPISPVRKTIYAMMFLLGLLIPGTLLVVRELLNNKVINENDIEGLTSIPIVGSISQVEQTNSRESTIVVGPHIRTGIAEQFRLVRANLEFMSASTDKKVYMVTSSTSGEGKSFISINLGITMTLAKKRVIIMEFDLRKPKISSYLGINNDGGISGYLANMSELDGAIKASGIHENLYIANCGPIPPNPGELLVLPKTKELIEELQEMFDVVIIDTAPIGIVSDALVLSKYAGINLFVVRQSYTIKDQIRMFDVLHKDGKILNPAILFNGVEYLKKYGYGYGSGGYGYGYAYGQGYEYSKGEASGNGNGSSKKKKKKKRGFLGFFLK